jgi:hypothetical protein
MPAAICGARFKHVLMTGKMSGDFQLAQAPRRHIHGIGVNLRQEDQVMNQIGVGIMRTGC